MSDGHLRELERRAKETGLVQDQATVLVERVRIGNLEQSHLELASYCGDETSVLAVGEQSPAIPLDLDLWVEGLYSHGREVLILAAFVSACNSLLLFEKRLSTDTSARHAVTLIAQYLTASKLANRGRLHDASSATASVVGGLDYVASFISAGYSISFAARATAFATRDTTDLYTDARVVALLRNVISAVTEHATFCESIRSEISEVLIKYALHGWRDFAGLIPSKETS